MLPFWHFFSKHIHTYNLIFSSKDTLSDKKGSLFLVGVFSCSAGKVLNACGRLKNGPSRMSTSCPLEPVTMLLYTTKEVLQIWASSLIISRWGAYPAWPGGAQSHHKASPKRKARRSEAEGARTKEAAVAEKHPESGGKGREPGGAGGC